MKLFRPYFLFSLSLLFLLGACSGGASEDQQATLVAVAVSAALTESAAGAAPAEGEEASSPAADDGEAAPAATAEPPAAATAAPSDPPATVATPIPVVVFQAAGSFSDAEENQLRQRVVQPFVMYYAELAEHPTLVSFSLEKTDGIAGYPYSADAIFEGGVTAGFLISNNSAPVDWWFPDCLGPCPFSDAFRAAYPEIIAIVEP